MADEHGPDAPDLVELPGSSYKFVKAPNSWERKYLPTLAELIDRLSIVQLKEIFISENKEAYVAERKLIEADITSILQSGAVFQSAEFVRACMMIMLCNRTIWLSESKAREGGDEQDKLLKFSHSINGVRAKAKNAISRAVGERVDLKVDAFAANLPGEYGSWDVF